MIDEITYKLSKNNYIPTLTAKRQILLAHSFNHDMKHVIGWKHRNNGKYKKTASFTIATDGTIYQHFDPLYYSNFLGNTNMDKKTITILIENDGYLLKNTEKNLFLTWLGNIYKKPTEVIEKRWRDYIYWSPYNKQQIESAIKLIKKLCIEFSIPMVSIAHNTKIDGIENYEGVLYRSNLDKVYTDLNPSWNFEEFRNKLEANIN